jgi:hypothetical protein
MNGGVSSAIQDKVANFTTVANFTQESLSIIGATISKKALIKGMLLLDDYDKLRERYGSKVERIDSTIKIRTKGAPEKVCALRNQFIKLYPSLSKMAVSCGASGNQSTLSFSSEYGDILFQAEGYDYKEDQYFPALSGVDVNMEAIDYIGKKYAPMCAEAEAAAPALEAKAADPAQEAIKDSFRAQAAEAAARAQAAKAAALAQEAEEAPVLVAIIDACFAQKAKAAPAQAGQDL